MPPFDEMYDFFPICKNGASSRSTSCSIDLRLGFIKVIYFDNACGTYYNLS